MPLEYRTDGSGEVVTPQNSMIVTNDIPITAKVVFSGIFSGLLGVLFMLPLLVGIPQAVGVFRTEPLIEFAKLGMIFGLDPNMIIGMSLFVFAGTVVLPLLFIVTGAFLPPRKPQYGRGIVFATVMWSGFSLAFWPGADVLTIALFLAFSLSSHWIYGLVLGVALDRLVGIPQHSV